MAGPQQYPHKLGLLFVHGIGEQKRGATLSEAAGAVVRWLELWLSGFRDTGKKSDDGREETVRRGSLRVLETRLTDANLDVGVPAHVQLEITTAKGTDKWLFAEAWWADDFPKPSFQDAAAWFFTAGAWVILAHFGQSIRLLGSSGTWLTMPLKSAFVGPFLFVLGLVFALALQTFTGLLFAISFIPIERLREALSAILLAGSGIIGDSYVFVRQPVLRAACITGVDDAVRWLADKCETTVIVAHSQGSAVAFEALHRYAASARIGLFVTVGQGVVKLTGLRLLNDDSAFVLSEAQRKWLRALPLLIALLPVLGILAFLARSFSPWAAWATTSLIGVLLIQLYRLAATKWEDHAIEMFRESVHLGDLPWVDFHASHDPVSNGPMNETPVKAI